MSDPTPTPSPSTGPAASPAPGLSVEGAPPTRTELDKRFAEAWVNDRHRVCGLTLPPYCLQHLLHLELVRSPFIGDAEGRVIRWSDVWIFLAICRTPWRGVVRFPSPFRIAAWAWFHRAARALRLHRVTAGLLGRSLAVECARIRAYQSDYATSPEMLTEGEGRLLTAPALLQRSVFLQRELGKSAREVEMQGLGFTLWEYAATLEQVCDGVELVDEEGSRFFDDVEAIQAGRKPLPPEIQALLDEAAAECAAQEERALGEAAASKLNPSIFGT